MGEDEAGATRRSEPSADMERRLSARVVPLARQGARDPESLKSFEVQAICRAFLRKLGLNWIE